MRQIKAKRVMDANKTQVIQVYGDNKKDSISFELPNKDIKVLVGILKRNGLKYDFDLPF